MKKELLILIALMVSSAIWVSCSQEDDFRYSCDDEVNEMVKTNLEEIHSMTRSQWKDLDTNVSLAVYRAFTPEQKIQFWKEKFAEVESLGWNEEELAHIEKAEAFVNSHPELFVEKILSGEDYDKIEIFFYQWMKEAEMNLGWKKQVVYAIAATGYPLVDTSGTIELKEATGVSNGMLSMGAESDCNCNTKSSISCFPAGPSCEGSSCSGSADGCGWLWRSSCNGRCGGY